MKEAWKKNQDGKGKERQQKKNAHSRRGNRKLAKAKRRGTGLEDSGLDPIKFGFLADPAFQSSDYSDPENKKRCVVHEPAYRTGVVNNLALCTWPVAFATLATLTTPVLLALADLLAISLLVLFVIFSVRGCLVAAAHAKWGWHGNAGAFELRQ
ncbi:hypothetical protein FRC08_018087 [Ceratobasidium sp. 394]|nr:hypothetical protein FRC08_018087 [Ceratobasidium sp. 394]